MENIVNTNNTNLRLCELRVGLFSVLRVSLPQVSPDATDVQVIVTNGTIATAYTAAKNTDGVWVCDIEGSQFSAFGKQKYEVAYKLGTKQFWDGQGWVNVVPATTSGIVPQPVPPPHRWAIISITQGDITHYADENGDINLDDVTRVRWDNVIGKPDFAPVAESGSYDDLEDVPTEFPPSAHTHTKSQITDFPVPVIPSTEAANDAFASAKKVAEFVNSSINNLAAFYLTYTAQGGAFPTKAALDAATTFYNGGVARVPTKNDYLIVLADEEHTTALGVNPTTRYVFDGAQWAFQYVVNNTSLTQAQVDAINSGITALLTAWLSAFKGNDTNTTLAALQTAISGKQAQLSDTQLNAVNSGITSALVAWLSTFKGSDANTTLASVIEAINGKLDKTNGGQVNATITIAGGGNLVVGTATDNITINWAAKTISRTAAGVTTSLSFPTAGGTIATEEKLEYSVDVKTGAQSYTLQPRTADVIVASGSALTIILDHSTDTGLVNDYIAYISTGSASGNVSLTFADRDGSTLNKMKIKGATDISPLASGKIYIVTITMFKTTMAHPCVISVNELEDVS